MRTKLGCKVYKPTVGCRAAHLVGIDCLAGKVCCGVTMGMLLLSGVLGTVRYVMSGDMNNIDQGAGNDLSIVQQSSGIHLLEVNTEGMSCEGQGWLWVEVACVIFAICLGLT